MKAEKEILKGIGERLRAAREAKEWTQADMASAMSTSTSQISMLETGQREPGILTVYRFANVLGCRVADLLP